MSAPNVGENSMSAAIQKNSLLSPVFEPTCSFVRWCQRQTGHIIEPFSQERKFCDLAKRAFFICTLVLPLIGLIAFLYDKCCKDSAPAASSSESANIRVIKPIKELGTEKREKDALPNNDAALNASLSAIATTPKQNTVPPQMPTVRDLHLPADRAPVRPQENVQSLSSTTVSQANQTTMITVPLPRETRINPSDLFSLCDGQTLAYEISTLFTELQNLQGVPKTHEVINKLVASGKLEAATKLIKKLGEIVQQVIENAHKIVEKLNAMELQLTQSFKDSDDFLGNLKLLKNSADEISLCLQNVQSDFFCQSEEQATFEERIVRI